jgi:hypothetical protein
MMMFWVRSTIIKNQTTLQASNQLKEFIDQNAIDLYVTTCLDTIANEAIIRSSLQGGVFNFSGMQYDKDYITYHNAQYNRTFNISIAVKTNTECDMVRNYPPDYPYPNSTVAGGGLRQLYNDGYDPATCIYNDIFVAFSGFFGYNGLTKLCSMTGPNRPLITSTLGYRSCEIGTYNDFVARDIQDEMQQYISQEIKKCVNFSTIEQRSASNITVLNDSPTAEVVFSSGGFTVRLNYSFAIAMNMQQPVIKMMEFAVKKNTPLKEIYDYAFLTITNDVSEVDYDIINDRMRPDILDFYRGYDVLKIKDIDDNYTDIIQIIDNGSIVNGKPLIFEFALQNRRPALEHIGAISPYYDYIGIENETLELDPIGYDPDEDHVFYNYSLWKEDYDDYFNYSDPQCSSGSSYAYIVANCTVHNLTSHPHNWTNSTLFILTHQNASFATNRLDAGFHIVNISIWDRQFLNDYQTVRIMVLDRPFARVTGTNFYPDVDDYYASYEDPYLFNGSNSTIGIGQGLFGDNFSTFIWNDTTLNEFFNITHITSEANKLFLIPNMTNGTYGIMTIAPYVFSNNTKNISMIRRISLIANTTKGFTSFPAILTLNVTQCLNHSNSTNPPYPYNILTNDLQNQLSADHACCLDSMTYAKNTTQCFNNSLIGANISLNFRNTPLPPPAYKINYIPSNNPVIDNDIFNRTFTRFCSGDRGNVCTGAGAEIRKVLISCNDTNFGTTPLATDPKINRCSGPPIDSATKKFLTSAINNLVCQNYTNGNTFEKLAKLNQGIANNSGDDYCNLNTACSTNPNSEGYSSGGHFSCQGECSPSQNGKCTFAANCTCNAGCGANLTCVNSGPGNHPINRCDAGGQKYFQDSCNDCIVSDITPNVCVSGGGAIIGCNANINCNNRKPLDASLSGSDKYCTMNCQEASCVEYNYNQAAHLCYSSCLPINNCAPTYQCCHNTICTATAGNTITIGHCYK